MPCRLKPLRLELTPHAHLELVPDEARAERYLVRFCGLPRDPHARYATKAACVRLMMASRRGEAPHPYPLPERVTIGWLDHQGWHVGRSPFAEPLARLEPVQRALHRLLDDLELRVALAAAGKRGRRD
jgi:hypothetical protein